MVARIKVAERVANTRLRMGEPPFCQVLARLSAETADLGRLGLQVHQPNFSLADVQSAELFGVDLDQHVRPHLFQLR